MILRGILTLSLLAAVINADDTAAYAPSITVANESDPPASTLKSTPTLATPLQTASGSKYCKPGYTLVWNDEFSSLASRQKWDFQRGDGSFYGIPGWGNNELQWYTNRSDNANVAGGNMILTARKRTSSDGAACPSGKCKYTSARIRTYKKFSINPRDKTGERTVRIETRVRLPKGTGMWPAIQMLPENSPANCSGCGQYGRWPTSGAITIAQAVNNMTDATGGLIYGAPFPQQVSSTWKRKLSTNFYHRFALEWTLQTMRFYIDDKKVFEAYSSQGGTKPNGWFTTTSTRKNAPFDQKFHILINLAVGGFATGASESQVVSTLSSPKYMAIDYVRVCRK